MITYYYNGYKIIERGCHYTIEGLGLEFYTKDKAEKYIEKLNNANDNEIFKRLSDIKKSCKIENVKPKP